MKKTRLDGMHTFSVYQDDKGIDFNGFFWKRDAGNVLIDPMPLSDADVNFVMQEGGVRVILLTNADHLRWAADAKERFGARVAAQAEEKERFGDAADLVDLWFSETKDLPDELRGDVELHPLRGGKSPVEPALHLLPLGALLFGDLVRSHVSGKLCLLPPPKISDREAVMESLEPLRKLEVEAILLGDGDCLWSGGKTALTELCSS
ncbi:MAG: MBL fold metallo-hydrolase [Planctomycetota bacterium]